MVLTGRVALACVVAAWVSAAQLTAAGAGQAGATVSGRVEIRRAAPAAGTRPAPEAIGDSTVHRAPADHPAVVFLESAPQGAFEREESRARMDQRGEAFVPHVLAITVGTTVDFPNSDPVFHNVFSLSRTKPFDLGRYAAGKSRSVRFDRPGIVQVFCEIHSHMSAYILVFAHRYFAVTGPDGRYRLPDVPPGTYTVVAWYEGRARGTRTITVGAAGLADIDFVVR